MMKKIQAAKTETLPDANGLFLVRSANEISLVYLKTDIRLTDCRVKFTVKDIIYSAG